MKRRTMNLLRRLGPFPLAGLTAPLPDLRAVTRASWTTNRRRATASERDALATEMQ